MMPRDDLPFCDCNWFERAAHDPNCPVEFDPTLNEYNLRMSNGGLLRMYHCPFCAGRAPQSLRSRMFAEISPEETIRLHILTNSIKTETELLAALGQPTHTCEPGIISVDQENDGVPPRVRTDKTLRFDQHSETATICATVERDGAVQLSFTGKYIGPPK